MGFPLLNSDSEEGLEFYQNKIGVLPWKTNEPNNFEGRGEFCVSLIIAKNFNNSPALNDFNCDAFVNEVLCKSQKITKSLEEKSLVLSVVSILFGVVLLLFAILLISYIRGLSKEQKKLKEKLKTIEKKLDFIHEGSEYELL